MMQNTNINNKGQVRLFENSFLESLTKTRPWAIYAIYIPLIIYLLFYSHVKLNYTIGFIVTVFFIAMLSWTLVEYIAHRYLFHLNAKSELGKRIVYIFHENHHEYPRDKMRLFMPPVPSIILACVLLGVFSLVSYVFTGTANYAYVYFSGFLSGYLIYVSMHYAIHAYAPPKFLKPLWKNHHLHHYKYPDKGFGVSSSFWDRIFGTVPENNNNF